MESEKAVDTSGWRAEWRGKTVRVERDIQRSEANKARRAKRYLEPWWGESSKVKYPCSKRKKEGTLP